VPDQGIGGRSLDVPIISSAPTGTWRVATFTDPKRPAIDEATFLVEDYVADRLDFALTTNAVMLAVILVIVVGTIRLIGTNSNNVFSSVASSIQ
jgi:uncharacterized protein YfaS (alpha-2-macroglobulin family)